MLKRFEQEKQDLLNRINEVMRYLRRINNTEALGKAAAVKEQIQQLNPKNPAIIDNPFKTIESLREEIGLLFEVINVYNEKEGTEVQQYDLDDTFRDRALKQMQQGVASFEKYLATLDKKIAAVEKQKVAGVAQCKTTIAAAREMASKVKAAKTYEEVRDLMDMMPEKAEELNECLHRLEQLTRLPRAIRYVNTKLTVTRTTVTRTLASAKRLKLDVTEPVERMRASLKEMEAAVVAVRAGTFEGEDLMEYIQTEVFDRADEIQEIAAGIEALTNVKRYVTQGTASIRRFTTLIASAERRKRDVTEAKEMLAELKEHHGELVTLSKARLTEDLVPEIIEHAQMMRDVTNDLADALAVDIDQNELQTRRSLESGGTTFDKAEVDDIENLIVRAFRVANYFRSNPMRSLAVLIY